MLRYLLATLLAFAFAACASHGKPRSRAQIYDGDSSPGLRMYDEAEKPGSPVGR
jgi:hypothetical protein